MRHPNFLILLCIFAFSGIAMAEEGLNKNDSLVKDRCYQKLLTEQEAQRGVPNRGKFKL